MAGRYLKADQSYFFTTKWWAIHFTEELRSILAKLSHDYLPGSNGYVLWFTKLQNITFTCHALGSVKSLSGKRTRGCLTNSISFGQQPSEICFYFGPGRVVQILWYHQNFQVSFSSYVAILRCSPPGAAPLPGTQLRVHAETKTHTVQLFFFVWYLVARSNVRRLMKQ